MIRKSLSLLLFTCLAAGLFAPAVNAAGPADQPFLHPLFSDNVVLQRGIQIPVWGWTEPGKEVTVRLGGRATTVVADADGKWMAKLNRFRAGGPYTMTVDGLESVTLTNVMIGDVWLCSGQSNMEMGVQKAFDPANEVAQADHPNIRLFTVPKVIARTPQSTVNGRWLPCSPETIVKGVWGGFSAVGYFFGRDLHRDLGVPIGLIHSSWGGTPAEAWTSAEGLKTMADFRSAVTQFQEAAAGQTGPVTNNNPNVTTVLYNGMIAPLIPFGIKGAIWYQGESNASRAKQYRTLLPTMIRDWRDRFEVGNFPFLIVQLANFQRVKPEPAESSWAELREAQSMTAQNEPNAGLAIAIDIGNAVDIHPRNKQEVGRRLALTAEAIAYGRHVEYSGPAYRSMKIKGNMIRLRFDHAKGGLVAKGAKLEGFAIAGSDRHYVWADATIDGSTVIVSTPKVANPVSVRYAWAENPVCNLYNKADLPASPFRTEEKAP